MAIGFWEPYLREVLDPLLKKQRNILFIDIGAHIGYYVVYVSRYLRKNGFIIAIEPDKRNLRVLYKNIKANNLTNVLVHEEACGSDGFLYLNPNPNPAWTKTSKTFGELKVPSVSLNSLFDKLKEMRHHTVIVKIDVEDAELDIIESGSKFIREFSPILIVETRFFDELNNRLKNLGYTGEHLFRIYYIFKKL